MCAAQGYRRVSLNALFAPTAPCQVARNLTIAYKSHQHRKLHVAPSKLQLTGIGACVTACGLFELTPVYPEVFI
jgi:hypothetical protein